MSKFPILVIIAFLILPCQHAYAGNDSLNGEAKILMLLGEWFGDTYFTIKDRLDELGIEFKRIGVDEKYRGCYNKDRDVELTSEILIPDIEDLSEFDCLLIPSGPQFRKFNENETVLEFVKKSYAEGLIIASLCTGNLVVNASGIVEMENPFNIEPGTVKEVKERVLMGSRGGGPPPGNGYKGAPVNKLIDKILKKIKENSNN